MDVTTEKIVLSQERAASKKEIPPNCAIILQARLGSTRVPGKILLPLGLAKRAVLHIILERLLFYFKSMNIPIIVATTKEPADDLIAEEVERYKEVQIYRGSSEDVLARYYEACREYNVQSCVRITSDCPFIDPELIHIGLHDFAIKKSANYLSNTIERTLPRGFDFEIFSFSALKEAFANASTSFEREHVTPFLYKKKAVIGKVVDPIAEWRITLDTVEDYYFLTFLAECIESTFFDKKDPLIETKAVDLIRLLQNRSDWKDMNSHVQQKS